MIKEDDALIPLNYIWNEDQTEATLNYFGKQEMVHWIDKEVTKRSVSYAISNLNQYKNCHAKGKNITPIGPTAAHWNKTYSLALNDKNQLDYFYEKGSLDKLVDPALRPKLPVWNDELLPVDNRAKAYLDANYAHYQNLEGSAKNS